MYFFNVKRPLIFYTFINIFIVTLLVFLFLFLFIYSFKIVSEKTPQGIVFHLFSEANLQSTVVGLHSSLKSLSLCKAVKSYKLTLLPSSLPPSLRLEKTKREKRVIAETYLQGDEVDFKVYDTSSLKEDDVHLIIATIDALTVILNSCKVQYSKNIKEVFSLILFLIFSRFIVVIIALLNSLFMCFYIWFM